MPGYKMDARGRPTPVEVATRTVNLAKVPALYALLFRAEPIYVGEADALGTRLRQHLSDELAGLWDEFTWVSPSDYCLVGNPGAWQVSPWDPTLNVNATSKQIVELLELVAINFSKQGLNSQKPSLNVKWLTQGRPGDLPVSPAQKLDELYEWVKNQP